MSGPQEVASSLGLSSHVVWHETESSRDESSGRDSWFGLRMLSILSK